MDWWEDYAILKEVMNVYDKNFENENGWDGVLEKFQKR